jgi:hypothetical protein
MNNLQTNSRRMVRKTGSTATETGESRMTKRVYDQPIKICAEEDTGGN